MVGVGGFKYQPVPAAAAVAQGQTSAADRAATTLKDYVAHVRNERTGEVKPGVLYLRSNQDGTHELRRDRAYHLSGRGRDAVKNASAEIKTLFEKAYQGRMEPRQYEALERSLSTYLTARSGQMGTKSLVRFQAAFEQAANRYEQLTAQARALPATVTAGLAGKADIQALDRLDVFRAGQSVLSPSVSVVQEGLSNAELAVQRQERNAQALAQAYSKDPSQADAGQASQAILLGQGGSANAFLVKGERLGSPAVVTVPLAVPESLTVASLGTGELAAATARAPMPHVAKPTAFLLELKVDMNQQLSHRDAGRSVAISGTQQETYEVPAENLEVFLKVAQEAGAKVTLSGVKMPAGPGPDLSASYKNEAITPDAFLRLAGGLYQGLQEMAAAGLVHHDIKPENVTFDPRSGAVMVIDTGAAVQLDPGTKQTTSLPLRTEKFTSPKLTIGLAGTQTVPHGADADRFAYALTLMCTLSPALMRSSDMPNEAMFGLYTNGATHAGGYVGAFLDGLDSKNGSDGDKAFAATVAAQLREAFSKDPLARSVLEHALAAGMTEGGDSEDHWSVLAQQLSARGVDLGLAVDVPAPVQPGLGQAAGSQAMSILPARDPKAEGRFVLPERIEAQIDPFDDFELPRRTSFYENKA